MLLEKKRLCGCCGKEKVAGIFWTPRRRKSGIISLAVVTSVLVVLVFTINSLLAPIIAGKIKNGVVKGSDSLYRVSFSKFELNIFTGSVVMKDVRLIPDSTRSAAQRYTGSVRELLITGAHPLRYWFSKKLEIGQITLIDPVISLKILKAPPRKPADQQTLYQKIAKDFKLIAVGDILLEHTRLDFFDYSATEPSVYHLKEWSINATGLLIDSATQKDTARTLFCDDITTGIRNFTGASGDGIYHYKIRSAQFSTRSEKLVLKGMVVQPMPASAFFASTKADRFSFDLDSMVIDHFNYRSFMLDHYLEVKKLSAYKGGIGIFANPNSVLKKNDRVVSFPNNIIRTIKTHFAVDTLDITGFDVSYTELNKLPAKTGTLLFKDTKARFLNITNQQTLLDKENSCRAQISSFFMGRGLLGLTFNFNLTDKVYAYSYSGHLGSMPLDVVNPLVMPLALVKLKSGSLKSLDFSIQGNQHTSTGTMHLLYNNLAIGVLDRNFNDKLVKTAAANTIIVKQDNPDSGSTNARFAKIVYIRPKNYPFFKTLWETLLSGIKPCAGIGYAVQTDNTAKPLDKKEQKAQAKALKITIKAKKKADKEYQKRLKKQAASQQKAVK